MRCPACGAENGADAGRCAACGAALARQPRRGVAEKPETPSAERGAASDRAARRAYRLSLLGLIPPAGLVLGPAAVVLGELARRRARGDPAFTAHGPAAAAVVLGAVVAVTNWVGVALMVFGLCSATAR
jgi:hypothetical protein